MRVNRLYSAQAIDRQVTFPKSITLGERASHYVSNVLRLKTGAPLCLFDGLGGEYSAEISHVERRKITVTLLSFSDISRQSPLQIQLAIGLSRGDRFDLVLQKATELGVRSIQPLLCQRSDRKPKTHQLEKKQQHWLAVVHSACEQCGLNIVPEIQAPLTVEHWLSTQEGDNTLLLHPGSKGITVERIQSMAHTNPCFTVAVGPEGGFSEEETRLMLNKKFEPLSLGSRILRTETAPLTILSVLQYAAGDLSVG